MNLPPHPVLLPQWGRGSLSEETCPEGLVFHQARLISMEPSGNHSKFMEKLFSNCLILFCLPFASQGIKAGLASPDPPGGWTYTFNGDAAAFGTGSFDALDGTWNRSNGSSEWDGSRVGPVIDVTTNKPGGASAFTEDDPASPGSSVTYL